MYGIYAQEEQIMNMITMSAPPAGPVPIRTLRYQPYPQNPWQRQFLSLRSNSPLSSVKRKKGSSSVGAMAPRVSLQEVNLMLLVRR